MRDNIKPIEAGFFKFCMKNLSHKPSSNYNTVCVRDDIAMQELINQYSKRYNAPRKILLNIVEKWNIKGLITYGRDEECHSCYFHPASFPMEYIILIPRRVLRKVPAFAIILGKEKGEDYILAFTFKTLANNMYSVESIKESMPYYWKNPSSSIDKYEYALFKINGIIDSRSDFKSGLLSMYVKYVMNSYNMITFGCNGDLFNYTIRTLKKCIKSIEKYDVTDIRKAAWVANHSDFTKEVNDFISRVFDELNCN